MRRAAVLSLLSPSSAGHGRPHRSSQASSPGDSPETRTAALRYIPRVTVRFKSLRFGPLQLVVAICFATAAYAVADAWKDAHAVIEREKKALALVVDLAEAEVQFLGQRRLDANADGRPEYGTLDALVEAGLVHGPLGSDAAGKFIALDGYRVEVLLPEGIDAGGNRLLARSTGTPDPVLASSSFAVVAMPAGSGGRVLRAFYRDAEGQLFTAEGVADPDRDPRFPPPRVSLIDGKESDPEGPVWRLASHYRK